MKLVTCTVIGLMVLAGKMSFADETRLSDAAPLGVQNINIGMQKDTVIELLKTHKEAKCYSPDSCQEMTFIRRPIKINYYFGKEIPKLLSIHIEFKNMHYDAIKEGFVEKYGSNYKVSTEAWQNKAGAKFDNTVSRWAHKDGSIEIRYLGSKRDLGEVIITSKELTNEIEAGKSKEKQSPGF